jgi:Pilus formation protein N terminal region
VTVVVRTMRRVYIIGADIGKTNTLFYEADGRQIVALDVTVSEIAQLHSPALGEIWHGAARGSTIAALYESADSVRQINCVSFRGEDCRRIWCRSKHGAANQPPFRRRKRGPHKTVNIGMFGRRPWV